MKVRVLVSAIAYLIMFLSTGTASEIQPAVCRELPEFSSTRTNFLNDRHRSAAKAVAQANSGGKSTTPAQLRNRINSEIRSLKGDRVGESILQVELLQLAESGASEAEI